MKKRIESFLKTIRKKVFIKRTIFIPLLILIILGVVIFLFRTFLIVATVNGQPIWRLTLIGELEKQGGKKTLDSLITKNLIFQEAGKQKVTVSVAEVDQQIKQIEDDVAKQGEKLDDLLSAQGLTRDGLREQIKIQKIVEAIVSKDIKITDQDLKDYFEKNISSFPENKKFEEVKGDIQKQLEQEKLDEKITPWIDQLHSNAKINYFFRF